LNSSDLIFKGASVTSGLVSSVGPVDKGPDVGPVGKNPVGKGSGVVVVGLVGKVSGVDPVGKNPVGVGVVRVGKGSGVESVDPVGKNPVAKGSGVDSVDKGSAVNPVGKGSGIGAVGKNPVGKGSGVAVGPAGLGLRVGLLVHRLVCASQVPLFLARQGILQQWGNCPKALLPQKQRPVLMLHLALLPQSLLDLHVTSSPEMSS